jgi:uncharacterized membrane protein YraQ (UPF0718 family)
MTFACIGYLALLVLDLTMWSVHTFATLLVMLTKQMVVESQSDSVPLLGAIVVSMLGSFVPVCQHGDISVNMSFSSEI